MSILTYFNEVKIDLPDGRRATASAVTPVSNSDSFIIDPPVDAVEGASVIGFVENTTGGIVPISNFYVGTTDTVVVSNREGQNVTVVSLNSSGGPNLVSKRSA